MRARILEALVLPNLALAAPGATHELSRAALLERCASAYAASGQSEKRVLVLDLLIETAPSANARDAARVEQAQSLVVRGDIEAALKYLGAIESEEMNGARAWAVDLKRRREADIAKAEAGKANARGAGKPAPTQEDSKPAPDAAQEVAR